MLVYDNLIDCWMYTNVIIPLVMTIFTLFTEDVM